MTTTSGNEEKLSSNNNNSNNDDAIGTSAYNDNITYTYYNISLIVLVIYLIIAALKTDCPSIAFLNCLTLLLLDYIYAGLSRGRDNKWSPGFKFAILISGRLIIMSSGVLLWVINYGIVYMIYSGPLIIEIINKVFPIKSNIDINITNQKNSSRFSMKTLSSYNVAANEFFCYCLLTFSFICLLLVTSLDKMTQRTIAMTSIEFAGAKWSAYKFGIAAILLNIIFGLLIATIRAIYLNDCNLLKGWSRETYFLQRIINFPRMLTIFLEIFLIFLGLLIFAITNSFIILAISIFVPLIVLCFIYAYRTWIKNQYQLVIWPPIDLINEQNKSNLLFQNQVDMNTELSNIYNRINDVFGSNDDDESKNMNNINNGGDDNVSLISDENNYDTNNKELGIYTGNDKPESSDMYVDPIGKPIIKMEEESYTIYDQSLPDRAKRHLLDKEHVLKGFRIPKLEATGHKVDNLIPMPTLPLKSVLRQKRYEMKIAVRGSKVDQEVVNIAVGIGKKYVNLIV